jgi:hypothetical protein
LKDEKGGKQSKKYACFLPDREGEISLCSSPMLPAAHSVILALLSLFHPLLLIPKGMCNFSFGPILLPSALNGEANGKFLFRFPLFLPYYSSDHPILHLAGWCDEMNEGRDGK